MQTFLPYPDYYESASCLDYKRLGKQRVEAKQILDILLYGKNNKWKNHPAVLQWKGYENSLIDYYNSMVKTWMHRGYKNTMPLLEHTPEKTKDYPPFINNKWFHASHRSKLLEKDFEFYSQWKWKETSGYSYLWYDPDVKMFFLCYKHCRVYFPL